MMDRRKAISVSISAGLGGAFGLVLWQSIVNFWHHSMEEKIDEGMAIAVVALAVVKFLEPITERFRVALHISSHHHSEPLTEAWFIRLVAFLILVSASLAHGLLHSLIEKNPSGAVGIVVAGLLIPGGITYCWLRGATQTPPHAKGLGLISGILISASFFWVLYVFLGGRLPVGGTMEQVPVEKGELFILIVSIPWAIMGFAGGLAIDKSWGKRPSRGVLLSILVPILLVDLYYLLTNELSGIQVMNDLSRVIGWGVGLMIHPDADALFTVRRPSAPVAPVPSPAPSIPEDRPTP